MILHLCLNPHLYFCEKSFQQINIYHNLNHMHSQYVYNAVSDKHTNSFALTSCLHLCLRLCVVKSYMARVPSRNATAIKGSLTE